MGIFVGITWIINFFVVFCLFLAATSGAVYFSFIVMKFKCLQVTAAGFIISIPLLYFSHSQLVNEYQGEKVYRLFAFSKITWRIEMLYQMIAAVFIMGLACLLVKKSKTAFSLISPFSIGLLLSGLVQSFCGLFYAQAYFKYIGAILHY